MRSIIKDCRAIGLSVNVAKCQLWGPTFTDVAGIYATIPSDLPGDSPLRSAKIIPFHRESGIVVLGSPVVHPAGTGKYAEGVWVAKEKDLARVCTTLAHLPDPQIQHTILRFCLSSCKVNFLLRTAPFKATLEHAEKCANIARNTMAKIIGLPMTDSQWQ